MTTCPCCGRSLEDVAVDLDSNVILLRGKPVPVQPKMAEVLAVLTTAPGRFMPRAEIAPKIWGAASHRWPSCWEETIRGLIMRLRQVMEPHGFTIVWECGLRGVHRGYRVERL